MSSKLIVALFLAAKYQMAAKDKAAIRFVLTTSYLLIKRFNQLSYAALLKLCKKFTFYK